MNLANIRVRFRIINPHGSNGGDVEDRNPDGNCTACASLAGKCLVNGKNPTQAPGEDIVIKEVHRENLIIRRYALGRGEAAAMEPWTWFSKHSAQGVYLVDQEGDHCFNLVWDSSGLYLIDSNLHVFKKLNNRQDAIVDGYDYMYPEPEDLNDLLAFYYLGPLHPNWT